MKKILIILIVFIYSCANYIPPKEYNVYAISKGASKVILTYDNKNKDELFNIAIDKLMDYGFEIDKIDKEFYYINTNYKYYTTCAKGMRIKVIARIKENKIILMGKSMLKGVNIFSMEDNTFSEGEDIANKGSEISGPKCGFYELLKIAHSFDNKNISYK